MDSLSINNLLVYIYLLNTVMRFDWPCAYQINDEHRACDVASDFSPLSPSESERSIGWKQGYLLARWGYACAMRVWLPWICDARRLRLWSEDYDGDGRMMGILKYEAAASNFGIDTLTKRERMLNPASWGSEYSNSRGRWPHFYAKSTWAAYSSQDKARATILRPRYKKTHGALKQTGKDTR